MRRALFGLLLAWVMLGFITHATFAAPAESGPRTADLRTRRFLPLIGRALEPAVCPAQPSATFTAIPVLPPPIDRPAADHPDLNLALRGYVLTSAYLGLVDYGGAADVDPPQAWALFGDRRTPAFVAAYHVYDWEWGCGRLQCVGDPIAVPEVTLLEMATSRGEAISIPGRHAEVYGGGYKALVLYAEERRITLKYTREDNVVWGYTVHLENICVHPALLSLYRAADAAGRSTLPALRDDEILGRAAGNAIGIAVRDSGTFLDPRSRKDWWRE